MNIYVGNLSFDTSYLERAFGEKQDAFGLVGLRPGAGVDRVRRAIKALLHRDYPATKVQTAQQFKDQQAGQVNQLLGLIYALLALAIVVSLVGIVNTLVLSISERTRELGLMRAIGTSRKQVKRLIRHRVNDDHHHPRELGGSHDRDSRAGAQHACRADA